MRSQNPGRLVYLVDEAGNVKNAYTEGQLAESKVDVIKRDLHLTKQDLENFISRILMLQLANVDGHTKNEGVIADALEQQDQERLAKEKADEDAVKTGEKTEDQLKDEREKSDSEFRTYFANLKGDPFKKTPDKRVEDLSDEDIGLKK